MDLKEIRGILNGIEMDDDKKVRIKIPYVRNEGFCVCELKSFTIMNGDIVFSIDEEFVPKWLGSQRV